jgi:LysR family transcriptional activator of glutamate synthase operon
VNRRSKPKPNASSGDGSADASKVSFRDLEIFIEFARTEHLGKTAEVLGYSVASIQRAVRALEQHLRIRLVKRSGRRVQLLHSGRVLADHARQVVRSRIAAVDATQRAAGRKVTRLAIGHNFSLGIDLVPQLLSSVLKRLPDTHVVLKSGGTNSLISRVLSGELDAAIVSPPPIEADLEVIPLASEPSVLIVGADDPLVTRGAVDIADLRDRAFVALAEGNGSRQTLFQSCARAGFTPRVSIEVSDMLAVSGVVSAGLAISIIPARLASYASGRVLRVPLIAPGVANHIIALAFLRRALGNPSLLALREISTVYAEMHAPIVAGGATK